MLGPWLRTGLLSNEGSGFGHSFTVAHHDFLQPRRLSFVSLHDEGRNHDPGTVCLTFQSMTRLDSFWLRDAVQEEGIILELVLSGADLTDIFINIVTRNQPVRRRPIAEYWPSYLGHDTCGMRYPFGSGNGSQAG